MSASQNQAKSTMNRRSSLEEEQLLCNEALESGLYDNISDDEWVALCQAVAAKNREDEAADEGVEN